jgi:hypothetical protein
MTGFWQHNPNNNSEKFAKAICFVKLLCENFALHPRRSITRFSLQISNKKTIVYKINNNTKLLRIYFLKETLKARNKAISWSRPGGLINGNKQQSSIASGKENSLLCHLCIICQT